MYAISAIRAVLTDLPDTVQSCDIEVDLGTNARHLMDDFGESQAMRHLAKKVRNFDHDNLLQLSSKINFIWFCSDGTNNGGRINSEDLLTLLPSALYKHQQDILGAPTRKTKELEGWVKDLLGKKVVTSKWH